jgi:DNA uptake lipoprotein
MQRDFYKIISYYNGVWLIICLPFHPKKLKMKLFKIFILLVVVFSQFSCKNYYESLLLSNDVDLKYKAAMEYFKNRKYRKAVELFDNLGLAVQGTPQEDTVNFYHGLSNYQYGDYQTAEVSLARFIEVFPRSPFIEQARFLRIKCLFNGTYRYELDQTPTKKQCLL